MNEEQHKECDGKNNKPNSDEVFAANLERMGGMARVDRKPQTNIQSRDDLESELPIQNQSLQSS